MIKHYLNKTFNIKVYLNAFILSIMVAFSFNASAQITLSGQLRPRFEFRDGYGTLEPKTGKSAALITQRSRIVFNYKWNKLIFHTAIQDVRVWGQDASTISNADGNKLGVHEAWAEILLANKSDSMFQKSFLDYLSLKIGRQELIYDDSRLLGNLDWVQQARRHDALVLKAIENGWHFDLGAAFNQNTDAINYNGTYYTPANVSATVKDSKGNLINTPNGYIPLLNSAGISAKNGNPAFINPPGTNALTQDYKALEFLHLSRKFNKTTISGLFLSDQFGKYILDSVKNVTNNGIGYLYGKHFNQPGVNTRFTTGVFINPIFGTNNEWAGIGSYYYQGGHDRDGLALNAYLYSISIQYKPSKLSYMAGYDYSSGNNSFSGSKINHRFDPLYGTAHQFHGFMDYFYAASGSPIGGLKNPYFKIRYTSSNKRFTSELANHYFLLASNQKDNTGQKVASYLGTEFDLTNGYKLNKFTGVDFGISYMAATKSMEYAKNLNPGTSKLNPVWAFIQFNIQPDFLMKL